MGRSGVTKSRLKLSTEFLYLAFMGHVHLQETREISNELKLMKTMLTSCLLYRVELFFVFFFFSSHSPGHFNCLWRGLILPKHRILSFFPSFCRGPYQISSHDIFFSSSDENCCWHSCSIMP